MCKAASGLIEEVKMSYRRNPFVFIPIVLTIAVLLIAPKTVEEHGLTGIFLVLAAIGFPWFLFYVIGLGVRHMMEEQKRAREAEENHDFV